ncbi:adenylate cyclase, partial [Burkholderia anthina]|nr:adenylate cyclase [Burkholderia anthina]
MNASTRRPPFAGKTFEVRYDGLTALNAYDEDGLHMRYEITEGAYAGARGEV